MTIDEPDTPFVRTPMSSGESSEDSSSTLGEGGHRSRLQLGEVSREARMQNLSNGVVVGKFSAKFSWFFPGKFWVFVCYEISALHMAWENLSAYYMHCS